jgi:galactose mutarotase-like enzyme
MKAFTGENVIPHKEQPDSVSLGSMDSLLATILPEIGGKVASITFDGHELLQQPLLPYTERTPEMKFEESDASGWDDCLPSVAACELQSQGKSVAIPDHGDLWRAPWTILSATSEQLILRGKTSSLPLLVDRTTTVTDNVLRMSYSLHNHSQERVPYLWSAHPLFQVAEGDRLILPDEVHELTLEGSAGDRLGKPGSRIPWPIAPLANGGKVDLSLAGAYADNTGDKLFTNVLSERSCTLERPSIGLKLRLEFDTSVSPILGLWLCYGGWPQGAAKRQYCIAIEPCSGIGDSLASTLRQARSLAPGEWDRWTIKLTVERL